MQGVTSFFPRAVLISFAVTVFLACAFHIPWALAAGLLKAGRGCALQPGTFSVSFEARRFTVCAAQRRCLGKYWNISCSSIFSRASFTRMISVLLRSRESLDRFPPKTYVESKPRELELSDWMVGGPRELWLAGKLRYGALPLEEWWPSRAGIGQEDYLRAGRQREITSLCPEVFKGVGAMAVRERQKWRFYLSILFIIHFNWALFSIKSSSLPRDLYFLWPKIIIILSTM